MATGTPSMQLHPAWSHAVDEIAAWVCPGDEGDAVRIGVVYGPPNSGKSTLLPRAIREGVMRLDTNVLVVHITDLLESRWQWINNPNIPNPVPNSLFALYLSSYEDFTEILQRNYEEVQASDPEGPLPATWEQPFGWVNNNILPPRVVFVIDVDPACGGVFFVFIVALSVFIVQTQTYYGSTARVAVLFVSTWTLENPVRNLVERLLQRVASGAGLKKFHLAEVMPPIGDAEFIECDNAAPALLEALQRATKDASHLVICFPPWGRVASLENVDLWYCERPPHLLENPYDMFNTPAERGRHLAVLVPHGYRAPFLLGSFERVHIVLGRWGEHVIIDAQFGQLASTRLTLRRTELIEQVAWMYKCPPGSARIYASPEIRRVIMQQPASEELVYRRLQFENKHLCGVMAALSTIECWGGDQDLDLSGFFVRNQSNYADRLVMLEQLGLMGSEALATEQLALRLPPEVQVATFRKLLAEVDYHPGLALFMILPAKSNDVVAVKIQLGALLAVGLSRVFRSFDVGGTPDGLGRVSGLSYGLTKNMTPTGTAWAMLGAWKRAAVDTQMFTQTQERLTVDLLDGRICINYMASLCVLKYMEMFAARVNTCRQEDVTPWDLTRETRNFRHAEEVELRSHLLRGFIHQLAVATPVHTTASNQSAPSVKATDVMSRCPLVVPDHVASHVDWNSIRGLESISPASGSVYFDLRRPSGFESRELQLESWTWIPLGLINDWLRLQGQDTARLLDVVRRRRPMGILNYDEVGLLEPIAGQNAAS